MDKRTLIFSLFIAWFAAPLFSQSYTAIPEPSAARDAFSRSRVSNPQKLFDAQFTYDLQPLLFEQITTNGTISHDATNKTASLSFSAAPSSSEAILQSYEHMRYFPGNGQLVFVTFRTGGGETGCDKFAGYSDGTNGVEYVLDDHTPTVRILSSTDNGNNSVVQSSWNIDQLDGTGPSGITLDTADVQIFVIDLQALYVGRVRVGFDIDGDIVYVHEFLHANNVQYPYIATANLPIRVGMTTTGTVTTDMNFVCSAVISEGAPDSVPGYGFSVEGTVTAGSGTDTHILSIEPDSLFNGMVNRSKVELESIDLTVTGANPVIWKLCVGQALTSTSRTDVNATYSAVRTVDGTLSGSPAIVFASGYAAASAQVKESVSDDISMRYPITLDASGGVRDLGRITVLVQGVGGTSATRCTLNWKEAR